jgi:hypothetical protein
VVAEEFGEFKSATHDIDSDSTDSIEEVKVRIKRPREKKKKNPIQSAKKRRKKVHRIARSLSARKPSRTDSHIDASFEKKWAGT